MLLGSGELGKELVISLQRLGVETIAVDRYANAPGHQVAHRSHVVALNDNAALRRVIEQERPGFVVPEMEGIAADVLVDIEDAGLARVVPTARATQVTMSREGTRRLAAETLRVPTSAYRFVDTLEALQHAIEGPGGAGIGYPCVVKPVMSSSGKGQSVVRTRGDLASAWQYAESSARVQASPVIVEAFIEFDYEITLLAVRAAGANGTVGTNFCDPIGHRQVQGSYVESWQPQAMPARALERCREIAHEVATALGGCGIFGVEFFIRGDEVWFSEVCPRPHDTGLVTLCTQPQSEFDLHARAMLGLPVDTRRIAVGASAVVYAGVDARALRYENVADALQVPHSDLRLFGKPEAYKRRRMGVALATADSVDEARARAQECAARVLPRA